MCGGGHGGAGSGRSGVVAGADPLGPFVRRVPRALQGRPWLRQLFALMGVMLAVMLVCPVANAQGLHAPVGCDATVRVTEALRRWVDQAGVAETVTLPDRLNRDHYIGRARVTYRIDVGPCDIERALLVPHMGAAYRVIVEGRPAARIAPGSSWWLPQPQPQALTNPRVPALYRLPASAREVSIEVDGSFFIPVGGWPVTVGPVRDVAPIHADLYRRAIDWTLSAGVMVTVVGALAMALAVVRRQRHPSLVWFTLACAAWVLRGIYSTATTVPVPGAWFETGVALAVFMLALPLAIATLHLLGRWSRLWRRLAVTTMLLVVLLLAIGLWLPSLEANCRTLVYLGMLLWMVVQCVMAWRHRAVIGRRRGWLIVGGYMALLAGACHDFVLVQGGLPIRDDTMSMLVWGYLLLLVAMAVVGADHVMHALTLTRDLNQTLEQRVAERSAALSASYEQRQAEQILLERERARREERERIVREMHDGIGGQLMTALRGVERGAFTPQRLAGLLQDSLDDLRLIIDATSADTRLLPALAAWRHRWDPRLEALGIHLAWQVDDAVAGLDLRPEVVLQLMRVLQEAVINAVKHAQATVVGVQVTLVDSELLLQVRDDGVGMPGRLGDDETYYAPGRQGLRSMRARAQAIGATIGWQALPSGGTCVVLRRSLEPSGPLAGRVV